MDRHELPEQVGKGFAEVRRISATRNQLPVTIEDLDAIVEAPLLSAARKLYLKGIQTMESDANPESATRVAGLVLNGSTMSDANWTIAEHLSEEAVESEASQQEVKVSLAVHPDNYDAVVLETPVSDADTVATISRRIEAIVDMFEPQPMTWAGQTLEDLQQMYSYPSLEEVIQDIDKLGVFEASDGKYYRSQQQADQASRLFNISVH